MALIQTDDRRLVRDTTSHALLNIDRTALTRHREQRRAHTDHLQLKRDVQTLQTQLQTLTTLVQQLLAHSTDR